MFRIDIAQDGIVHLVGRLDAAAATAAMATLASLDRAVTADCTALEYISSAGLGVIMETYKRLHGRGLAFRLIHLVPGVRNVFRYSGLDQVIEIA
jgi:anti-sigma B factor antagonist